MLHTDLPHVEVAEEIKARPVRRPLRWVTGVLLAVLAWSLISSAARNPRFEWGVVGEYLFSARILDGLVMTLELTLIATVSGIAIGVLLAIMRLSQNPLAATTAWIYVWLFRGTPLLVQILFWNFLSALYPRISFNVPFGGPELFGGNANSIITPFVAAILALGLNEGAYMSEIVRGGIISVDPGQTEAAHALGMTRLQILRRIVLPQAMRVIIPPTGNETISMLKTTSLVSVIALGELLYSAQLIYAVNYKQIPLLITVSIWYVFITSVLSGGQMYLERHFGRSDAHAPVSLVRRLWDGLKIRHARGAGKDRS